MLAGWRLPQLDDLMTCLEALLDVMDSFGFTVIFIDLGVFQDIQLASLRQPTGR